MPVCFPLFSLTCLQFLYYLFDRHWTLPDGEWKYLVDDFAASFGITRHSQLESFVFYLLDDHSLPALQVLVHCFFQPYFVSLIHRHEPVCVAVDIC